MRHEELVEKCLKAKQDKIALRSAYSLCEVIYLVPNKAFTLKGKMDDGTRVSLYKCRTRRGLNCGTFCVKGKVKLA